ncbi:DNA polymerase III subunit epsilon [Meridianimarinicoccus roseus]|uniref:DNA polymerase III subunit epsilon n=1 Tax=Meridianimarinicoccus roseus TaxID=2072018 RepID=A0A2V2LG57_9RHOB|nr:DNA polymerase III subunit epsilon [Meridianimarinicoccus roseus]PWR02891.1 DNA polymerase III subunit epsilon [Meridianimarinicoccus roseus]
MRELVLDTETTGLDPFDGHRLVEIGAVELVNHMPTGRTYHQYINPDRDMPQEAFDVHGISAEFLADKPRFREVAADFIAFCADATLVIHNASFDMKFINAELGWLNMPAIPMSQALDTLAIARKRFPGSPASLDALCRRFGIDNSAREKHGALLDSEILAEVYLELIGGRQPGLVLTGGERHGEGAANSEAPRWRPRPRPAPLEPRLTEQEKAAHAAFVGSLGDGALWHRYPGADD